MSYSYNTVYLCLSHAPYIDVTAFTFSPISLKHHPKKVMDATKLNKLAQTEGR